MGDVCSKCGNEHPFGTPCPARDGGPAFPFTYVATTRRPPEVLTHPGMTQRDWFAGMAMQAIFGGIGARDVADRDQRYDETNWAQVVAANAYEMADAMLEARDKK